MVALGYEVMGCFKMIDAFQTEDGQIEFNDRGGVPLKLPCGQCIGCRLERSRQWAMRCVHEASLHKDNCFITLTYSPENLPPDGGLIKSDFQKFMKRLRRKYIPKNPYDKNDELQKYDYEKFREEHEIKFYQCGEYGDLNNRPHYHAILFGHNFDDWTYLFDSPAGYPIYTSEKLEKIWGLGFVTIGTVTFESAAYVARYIMKKINGPQAEQINEKTDLRYYERFNSFTGEIHEVLPEYSTMSRGGTNGRGIAHNWISRYTTDVYPKDFTTIRGMRMRPPKYYDKYIQGIDPDLYDDIKSAREISMNQKAEEYTESRLKQKEKVTKAKHKQLKRKI